MIKIFKNIKIFDFNGVSLPSTGMWRGEVFAISDCLVVFGFLILSKLTAHRQIKYSNSFRHTIQNQLIYYTFAHQLPTDVTKINDQSDIPWTWTGCMSRTGYNYNVHFQWADMSKRRRLPYRHGWSTAKEPKHTYKILVQSWHRGMWYIYAICGSIAYVQGWHMTDIFMYTHVICVCVRSFVTQVVIHAVVIQVINYFH